MSTNTTIGTLDELANVRRLTTEVTRLPFRRRDGLKRRPPEVPPGHRPDRKHKRQKCRAPHPSWLWFARYSAKFTKRKGLCMHLTLERGVPQEEPPQVALGSLTAWDPATD